MYVYTILDNRILVDPVILSFKIGLIPLHTSASSSIKIITQLVNFHNTLFRLVTHTGNSSKFVVVVVVVVTICGVIELI